MHVGAGLYSLGRPICAAKRKYLKPNFDFVRRFRRRELGLEFNVDFSDASFLPRTLGLRFGDLILANFTGAKLCLMV